MKYEELNDVCDEITNDLINYVKRIAFDPIRSSVYTSLKKHHLKIAKNSNLSKQELLDITQTAFNLTKKEIGHILKNRIIKRINDNDFYRLYTEHLDNILTDKKSHPKIIQTEAKKTKRKKSSIEVKTLELHDSYVKIEQLFRKFHIVANQLKQRHEKRSTFEIKDEYDVQDLLHAMLKIHFNDVRPEEWTPSYASNCSRIDFLLKNKKIAIEVKKTRAGLTPKKLSDELIVDIDRYKSHHDCKTLFCFVYDPENRISNQSAIENDLSRENEKIAVKVIITPKGY